MTHRTLRLLTPIAILVSAMLGSLSLHAQPATPPDLLTRAYVTLSMADHDYKGHRVAAMKQVSAAAKALGIHIRGDNRRHEGQVVSDEQLRIARGMLEQARPGLKGSARRHVNAAINQINIALRIR